MTFPVVAIQFTAPNGVPADIDLAELAAFFAEGVAHFCMHNGVQAELVYGTLESGRFKEVADEVESTEGRV